MRSSNFAAAACTFLAGGIAAAALAQTARADGAGSDLTVLFVTDPTLDRVFRLQDANEDGDFNDAGETVVFYDGAAGPFALTDPVALTTDPFDQVFVADGDLDRILVLRDADGDGDALDPGESALYFDGAPGGNASGVLMPDALSVTVRILGTVWVTSADTVLRLRDANGDGDANDAGEAIVYWTSGLPPGASILTSIAVGYDGFVYVLENGSSRPRGLYRLVDLDASGAIDQASEVQTVWEPLQVLPGDMTSIGLGEAGEWYLLDRANQLIQIGFDVDSDGQIDANGEAAPFWAIPHAAFQGMAVALDGGEIYLADLSGSPDLIVNGKDIDQTGSIDNGTEVNVVYDDTLAAVDIDVPYSIATDFHDHEEVGTPYCTGASQLCPCANFGSEITGCRNSTGVGTTLEGTGTDGITNDDLVFEASQLPPNAPSLLYYGTAVVNGGSGAPFGDGLRCVTGNVRRLGVRDGDAIGVASWGPGLAASEGWAVGETRYFQVWYRNPAGPCGQFFNLSNGVQVTFTQ